MALRRLLGLAVALPVAAACVTPRGSELDARYAAIAGTLSAMGLAPLGPVRRGSLAHGAHARVAIDLPAGCATLVAVGGEGARDVDLVLADAHGAPIARDETRAPQAAVRACVDAAGSYSVDVRMADGSGPYVLALFSGGAPASRAAADAGTSHAARGTCDDPIALEERGGARDDDTARGQSKLDASCAKNDARELVYKLDLSERRRVVVDVRATFDAVVSLRNQACNDPRAEIACNDDTQNADRARVDAVLDPGTYYVIVDGLSASDAGEFHMTTTSAPVAHVADACARARPLEPGVAAAGSTSGGDDHVHATCGGGGAGPDEPYRLEVRPRARVRVTHHSVATPIIHVRRVCAEAASEVACATASYAHLHDAIWVGALDAGSYAVWADAKEVDGTDYTLTAEMAPEQGSGVAGDSCADATPLAPNANASGDTFRARDDVRSACSEPGAADVVYRVDLPARSRVSARVDRDEARHVLSLTRGCGASAQAIDCGARVDAVLAAGTYYLAVDGASRDDLGRFALQWRVRDLSAQESACAAAPAISEGVDVRSSTIGAGDRFSSTCGSHDDARGASDRVYKLTLAARRRVRVKLDAPAWPAVVSLRRSCVDTSGSPRTAEIACSGEQRPGLSTLDTVLDAGTYYLAVDGVAPASEGAFTLSYKTQAP